MCPMVSTSGDALPSCYWAVRSSTGSRPGSVDERTSVGEGAGYRCRRGRACPTRTRRDRAAALAKPCPVARQCPVERQLPERVQPALEVVFEDRPLAHVRSGAGRTGRQATVVPPPARNASAAPLVGSPDPLDPPRPGRGLEFGLVRLLPRPRRRRRGRESTQWLVSSHPCPASMSAWWTGWGAEIPFDSQCGRDRASTISSSGGGSTPSGRIGRMWISTLQPEAGAWSGRR